MPYIKLSDRRDLTPRSTFSPQAAGELNFQVTSLCLQYLERMGRSYQTYAEIEGVLSHVAKELYRRSAAPYEDKKIAENGDVFPEYLV